MANVDILVWQALGEQLGLGADVVAARADEDLEALGLDSHGLMRVLLALEQALGCDELELPDEALASPRTLAAAVVERLS